MSTPGWKNAPSGSHLGEFGPDDQRGWMNYVTPAKVLQGVVEVREGKNVPYKGAGEATLALVGGSIDFQIASTPGVMGQVKGGKLRLLAVSGGKRLAALPGVPTFAEAGVKGYGVVNFTGLWAPKGTPPEVLVRLQKEVAAAMATPDLKAYAEGIGADSGYWDAAAFARQLAERTAFWGKVAANTAFEKQ